MSYSSDVDVGRLLADAHRSFLIDPSYITNRSLVAVTQHCPRLVRLVLDVPCLDLTVPDVLHWMRALPPRRYVPVDGVPVVPDATPYRRRGYIRLRRGCIDRFPHNPTVESQAAFFDAIDEQLQALHPSTTPTGGGAEAAGAEEATAPERCYLFDLE
jgi:hypothetical protein